MTIDAKEVMTVPKKEQNAGVALLLERMKTNPEEFVGEKGFAYSKWGSLIGSYKEFLEPEDQETITNALNTLLQQKFTEKVLEELVDPKGVSLNSRAHPSVTLGAGTTLGLTTSGAGTGYQWANITGAVTGTITVTEDPLVNKKPTMFGKLFNYL